MNTIALELEELRKKVLNPTKKNPMIDTKINSRSFIRIVDEVPSQLLKILEEEEKKMKIIPLPPLEEEPKDEKTQEFMRELINAQHTDEEYKRQMKDLEERSDNGDKDLEKEEKEEYLERELKDRVRETLGLEPRQKKESPDLKKHARNHNISPSYDLPLEPKRHSDERHIDKNIQTLYLPDKLHALLENLCKRDKTSQEEKGTGILYIALGFLEWGENEDKVNRSPLVLIPVQIERKSSPKGPEFWMCSDGQEAQGNSLLAQKLKEEFKIELEDYSSSNTLEEYFQKIEEQKPPTMKIWNFRRWGIIGGFSFVGLTMYKDLDPEQWESNLEENSLVSTLLKSSGGASSTGSAGLFCDDYNTDEEETEQKFPYPIFSADPSQFSTIVDVVNGKDLAVEGPPGTGKSQTIMNTIAAMLADRKKVLFIAQKQVAIEVVRSRLQEKIGDYVLSLQPKQKKEFYTSLKKRVEHARPGKIYNYNQIEKEHNNFGNARKKIQSYLEFLGTKPPKTNLTIHEILGRAVKHDVMNLPKEFKKIEIDIQEVTKEMLRTCQSHCTDLYKAYKNASEGKSCWEHVTEDNVNLFSAETILENTEESSTVFTRADEGIKELNKEQKHHFCNIHEVNEYVKDCLEEIEKKDWSFPKDYPVIAESFQTHANCADAYRERLKKVKKYKEHVDGCGDYPLKALLKALSLFDFREMLKMYSNLPEEVLGISPQIKKRLDDSKKEFPRFSKDFSEFQKNKKALETIFEKRVFEEKFWNEYKKSIDTHIKQFSSAGVFFFFFSKEYRKSRKFYRRISKSGFFVNGIEAEKKLHALVDWKNKRRRFEDEKKEILGPYKKELNLDSNIKSFEEYVDFVKEIENTFGGDDKKEFRQRFKEIDSENLPRINDEDPIFKIEENIKLADLECCIEAEEKKSRKCKSDAELVKILSEGYPKYFKGLDGSLKNVPIDTEGWLEDKSYSEISEMLKEASQDKEGLLDYSNLLSKKNQLYQKFPQIESLVENLLEQSNENFPKIIEARIIYEMLEGVYNNYNKSFFQEQDIDSLRKKFQDAHSNIIEYSPQHIQSIIHCDFTAIPEGEKGKSTKDYTEGALIKHECAKEKRHISVRRCVKQATESLLELKPCWMMSPLTVAEYLPQKEIFDLVIIDEASQMPLGEALGALLRAKNAMIVGDRHQLPATSAFKFVYKSDDAGIESVLDKANSVFPKRRLQYHYRSKHESLISFSNKHIYNDKLEVSSSPIKNDDLGVYYTKVEGKYSGGGENLKEAEEMALNICEFMEKNPKKSLGVVVMNATQQELLDEQMKLLRSDDKDVEKYIKSWEKRTESFFIKALENVQGDERDVIFIGTVYGPDKQGRVFQRFGDINKDYGYRRLNVLFTRAKEKIVTFSSMTPEDITAKNRGAEMLKKWLLYSYTGQLEGGEDSGREPDSTFEEAVIEVIESWDYKAVPQVGVKRYRIDIGIKHPAYPYGYLMGIECDGAQYHSSYDARQRDHLREEFLKTQGWKLYRIWSTDWFHDKQKASEKLKEELDKALREKTSTVA